MQDAVARLWRCRRSASSPTTARAWRRRSPDLVILCPATAEHGLWTRRVAEYGVNIVVEKPFAASLAEADAMVAAQRATGKLLAINWPTRWSPCYHHGEAADRRRRDRRRAQRASLRRQSRPALSSRRQGRVRADAGGKSARAGFTTRRAGGGSLLDYAGYGATLGTWFQGGRKPLEVTCTIDEPPGLEVDEHSVTVCRYAHGLSTIETRWGTFTDPWILSRSRSAASSSAGRAGRFRAYDYATHLRAPDRGSARGI